MRYFAELDSPFEDELLISSVDMQEALSEPARLSITALCLKADLDFAKLLGEHVTVRLKLRPEISDEPRCFDALVEQVSLVGQAGRYFQYAITARSWFWFLSQTQDCRIFQNQTVLQILEEVLNDHPIAEFEDRTTHSFTPWTYCVQYRESDFNFLSRLMEQEGIFYYFVHEAGKHVMVLCDSTSGVDPCPGCVPLPVRYGDSSRTSARDTVWDFSTSQRVQPGAAVIQDYDFTRPQVDLRQTHKLEGEHSLGDLEVFDYPGFFDREGDGEQFVRAQMEEYACVAQVSQGQTDAHTLACGGLLQIKGSLREGDNIEYLVTGARIHVHQTPFESAGQNAGSGFSCHFSALSSNIPYRSARKTPKPVVQGPQTAVVVGPGGEEIFTDKYGRVKVQFHWDRYGKKNEKSSCWVRTSSPWAGKSFGFVQVPRIGQEVVVDFLEGDPDQPLITGRVYNAEQMPPWELPANATQSGVLSRSSKGGAYGNANALRFEDKKGSEQVWLHAEKNQDIEVENDETHWVGHDRTKTIDHDETSHIKHDRTETVDNNETITVHGQRTEVVDKNETISIHQNRTESVDLNETISIGANRTEDVAKNETISIGANRSESVGKNESIDIAKNRDETVGENETVSIGKNREHKIGKEEKHEVGENRSTQIGKDDKLQVGKKLYIEAADEITLKTGDASITMKKDGTIQIKGKDITIKGSGKIGIKADGDVVIKGSKIAEN